jgi:hypothetical protein
VGQEPEPSRPPPPNLEGNYAWAAVEDIADPPVGWTPGTGASRASGPPNRQATSPACLAAIRRVRPGHRRVPLISTRHHEIPVEGRITAIGDAFDALTTDRRRVESAPQRSLEARIRCRRSVN